MALCIRIDEDKIYRRSSWLSEPLKVVFYEEGRIEDISTGAVVKVRLPMRRETIVIKIASVYKVIPDAVYATVNDGTHVCVWVSQS